MSCHGLFDILKKRKTDDRNNVNLDDFESNTGCGMGIHCSECPLSFRCSHNGNKDVSKTTKSGQKIKKVLLMGNPNVGKSAIFSRLTGLHAISSNYPGTTVGFLEGSVSIDGETYKLIDVPGAYTVDPTNEAEEVARRILDEGGNIVVIVADATALERNLYLALQVLEKGYPSVLVLNMVDEARHKGIHIDLQTLERELGIPVVSTVAVT